jgi:glycosyltransferase involved in cell wall biosynthesis
VIERPLAILMVGDYPDDPRLGSSKVAHKLREEFVALGHTCDVLWTGDIGRRPASRQIRQLISPWMSARAVAAQEGRRRYDVIDAASAEGEIVGLLNLISPRTRAALICRSHGLEHLNYARMIDDHRAGLRAKSWARRVWYPASRLSQVAAAARLADALLLINDVDRDFALARGWQDPDRIAVVPHGISSRFVDDAPAADAPRDGGLLFCGTWDYVKGTPYLCEALRLLHARGTAARLTVLGPGIPAAAVLADFDAAVRPFVTVIDRVPEERVMSEYRRHQALVFASTYEGFGLVALEAMSQRLPVIATPVGCAASLVRDGETGYRVPARDAGAIAGAVQRLLDDPAEARRRAANARALVAGMTWRRTAQQTIAVYSAALARLAHARRTA